MSLTIRGRLLRNPNQRAIHGNSVSRGRPMFSGEPCPLNARVFPPRGCGTAANGSGARAHGLAYILHQPIQPEARYYDRWRLKCLWTLIAVSPSHRRVVRETHFTPRMFLFFC